MKKSLTTILILITLAGYSQPLMLSCRKQCIKAELRTYVEYKMVPAGSNYLNYEKGSIKISYELTRQGLGYICNGASITMPLRAEEAFVNSKTGCDCWIPIEDDVWLFDTHLFDAPVIVRRIANGASVTFKYSFDL
jgi:hypothetical protein